MSSFSTQPVLNGVPNSTSSESSKVTPPTASKHLSKMSLSNGHADASQVETSTDDPPITTERAVIEMEATANFNGEESANNSPLTSEKIPSRQLSHECEDSSPSIMVSAGDATISESWTQFQSMESHSSSSTSTRAGKNGVPVMESRGDSEQPTLTTEVAVAYSPDGRFLKYDIEIGRGAFKTVYKGLDTETGVAIAWCELQEKRYNKAEQARFKEEVNILKTLQHPNILKLYGSWESSTCKSERKDKVKDKVLVLVTELMTSGTLKSYMRRIKSIKPKVIRSWGRQILKGLHFLHTRMPPIIHRDLKCDNIFINGTTGLVKIGDLGLATLKRNDVTTVIGTPEFMAPEMYEESYDESVDVYAFGMCLLEMCTQEYPYMECSNPAQIYKRVSQGIKPHALDKVKDAALRNIIEKCTTVKKESRFTVLELLDHEYFSENIKIEMVLGSEPADTQPDPTPTLTVRMDIPHLEPNKKNGQEAIEFPYHLTKDVPEDVVGEMVKSGIVDNNVQQVVSRSLREFVVDLRNKLQGRNKADNEGKLAEPKLVTVSQSPSPAPGNAYEATPTETVSIPVQLQRQPSVTAETSKPDESTAPKESVPGLDMTGQAAIPVQSEKEKVGLNLSKALEMKTSKQSETKTSNVVSPVSQPSSEHALGTGQQITASTGQAVPQTTSLKEQPQSSAPISEPKSYSVVGLVNEKQPIEATQESSGYLSAHVQELSIQSDASAESTPVHLPPHSDDSGVSITSGGGTLKKKGRGQKGRGIKLTLIEHNTDTKVLVCQLSTSNNKLLKYQFSIKYDKPDEMFKKFVTAGHLTDLERDDFIQQSNQLIHKYKKNRDLKNEVQESKPPNLSIQETTRPRAGTEPSLSPPLENTESVPKLSIEQSSQIDPRLPKTMQFTETGSPKMDPSKGGVSESLRVDLTSSSETLVTSESIKDPVNPLATSSCVNLSNAPIQRPQAQQADHVSTLATPITTTQEPSHLHSPGSRSQPQQLTTNQFNTVVPNDQLSSCSLPSIQTQFPVSLPSCNLPTQPNTVNPITTQASVTRVFEVETVAEDKPDSPYNSDASANGSTENLRRESHRSDSQDSNASIQTMNKKFVPSLSSSSLESKSDSYIGKDSSSAVDIPSSSGGKYPATTQQGPEELKSGRHHSLPYVLPPGVGKPSSQRHGTTSSIPEHYCTTPALDSSQRSEITKETYMPPDYRGYPSSNTIYSHHTYSSSDSDVLEAEPAIYRPPVNIDELPQAHLLSEAFMRFMHSMSMVFRDPTFQPLISSLDRRFGSQVPEPGPGHYSRAQQESQDRRFNGQPPINHPQQETLDKRVTPQATEASDVQGQQTNVSRAFTDPGVVPLDNGVDEELQTVLERFERERRELERKKQLAIENYKRKHSSGNSSLESSSGLPEYRRGSTTSQSSQHVIFSPTQQKKLNKLEGVTSSDNQPPVQLSHKQVNHTMSEMEKRVRDELMTDKLHSDTPSILHHDHSPSRSKPHHQQLLKSSYSNSMQTDCSGSISPGLQVSPPPLQTVGQATFQLHTNVPSVHQSVAPSKIPRSDSNEWTDYTSAPVVRQASGAAENRINSSSISRGPTRTGNHGMSIASDSRADVSEFDPISSNTNMGPFAQPKS